MWSGALLSFRPSIHLPLHSLSTAAMKYYAAFLPSSVCRGACKNAAAAGLLFPCDVFPPRDGTWKPLLFPTRSRFGAIIACMSCRVVVVAPKPSFHSIMRRLRSPLYRSEFRLIRDTLTNPNATFGIPRTAIASLAVIPAFPISK